MTGVTADTTLWTADTLCVTADGRIIRIAADVVEPVRISVTADTVLYTADATWPTADGGAAGATDSLDAVVEVVGAVIVVEAAAALDQLDAVVEAAAAVIGGGARYYPPPRPAPVEGVGYGILPALEGEAHGTVGAAGDGEADDFPNDLELMLMMLAA
jgi:hypothetical protein